MVIILSPQTIDMQRHARGLRKALQSVRYHLRTQVANLLSLEPEVYYGERPVGEVDYGAGQCFVQGRVGVAEAREPRAGAEGGFECGSESEECVFGGVVVVDWFKPLAKSFHGVSKWSIRTV